MRTLLAFLSSGVAMGVVACTLLHPLGDYGRCGRRRMRRGRPRRRRPSTGLQRGARGGRRRLGANGVGRGRLDDVRRRDRCRRGRDELRPRRRGRSARLRRRDRELLRGALHGRGSLLYRSDSLEAGADLGPFCLDRFEVTVGRFRNFVNAKGSFGTRKNPPKDGAGAVPGVPASGWSSADNTGLAKDTSALESRSAIATATPAERRGRTRAPAGRDAP